MILTYYQAVELMTFLPALLSHANEKLNNETTVSPVDSANVATEENLEVYTMWNSYPQTMEVNGADFY